MLNRLLKYHCVSTDLKVVVKCRDGDRMGALAPEDGFGHHSQALHTNSLRGISFYTLTSA
jgi:hypothetical protein